MAAPGTPPALARPTALLPFPELVIAKSGRSPPAGLLPAVHAVHRTRRARRVELGPARSSLLRPPRLPSASLGIGFLLLLQEMALSGGHSSPAHDITGFMNINPSTAYPIAFLNFVVLFPREVENNRPAAESTRSPVFKERGRRGCDLFSARRLVSEPQFLLEEQLIPNQRGRDLEKSERERSTEREQNRITELEGTLEIF
ncbi:uncharacterized protein LOC131187610 isoform X3 [Ahaetulla prasina]|uniref:uncharacterized protein LOC131187610 isoform X3 n=1 Tax=Ahaetulla prasina TaxID=499056 RepID=UPI002649D251|nr:uncharacterized protein LOC131187610 isoform X3 [Ahaetulla prasina]